MRGTTTRRSAPGRSRRAAAAALLPALVPALAACSAIVGGEVDPARRCVLGDGGDPCAELGPGWRCVANECQQMDCAAEVCGNGEDDDCDGSVDEVGDVPEDCDAVDEDCDGVIDEGLDADGDGFTWCPTGPGVLDCNDEDANVRPGTPDSAPPPELCDGLDNDCDASTVDGSGVCSAEQVCQAVEGVCEAVNCSTRPSLCSIEQVCDEAAAPPVCIARDMTCLNPARPCPAGQVCNTGNGECVTPQPLGTPCEFDAECDTRLCVASAALRLTAAHVAGAPGICSRACCGDGDCGEGSVCWASGSGARACVPEAVLAMGRFGAPTNRLCHTADQCADECVFMFDDAYEQADRATLTCGQPQSSRSDDVCVRTIFGQITCSVLAGGPGGTCIGGLCWRTDCRRSRDCPSGLCIGGRCTEPCGSSEDCPVADGLPPPTCDYAFVNDAGRTDFIPVCRWEGSGGVDGAACESDEGCRDDACLTARGLEPARDEGGTPGCRDACCNDTQCGANEQCKPVFIHGRWENHCLPRETFGAVGMPLP